MVTVEDEEVSRYLYQKKYKKKIYNPIYRANKHMPYSNRTTAKSGMCMLVISPPLLASQPFDLPLNLSVVVVK